MYNGDSKFECKTKKTARSGTLETGILKQLYLFSEKKVQFHFFYSRYGTILPQWSISL